MSAKTPWSIPWCFFVIGSFEAFWIVSDGSPGNHGGLNSQGFVKSIGDANLMFEFLLNGLEIDEDNNILMRDQELASMRQGRAFLALLNDNVPKTVTALEKLAMGPDPWQQDRPLSSSQFDRLVLGAVYSAYQARRQPPQEQQPWTDVLGSLANATFVDLRRPYVKL